MRRLKPPVMRQAIYPGHKLLHGKSCSLCSSETGGVGAAATDLLEMTDVLRSKGKLEISS